jgi:uncharacterized protein
VKIKINEVPKDGLIAHAEYDAKELDMETPQLHYKRPISVNAEIKLVENELFVKTKVFTNMSLVCVRCLKEYEISFTKNYSFHYNIKNLLVIDITSDLREEIILDYPLRPLCRQDCKGICPGCGADLNNEECKCQMKT